MLRFESGNLGDYKSVGGGILESRIDFGPGSRIYFGIDEATLCCYLSEEQSERNRETFVRLGNIGPNI